MIYLSGAIRPEAVIAGKVGYMLTPNMGNRPDLSSVTWGADTGCYTKGEDFDLQGYLDWLDGWAAWRHNCLFATAPDVVADSTATWWRSVDILPLIRRRGYKAALVAQDGIEWSDLRWAAFDVLFIGGTTEWKLSSLVSDLVREAKEHGKWVHMGRVNSLRRAQAAVLMKCDSSDGTFVAFGPDKNIPRMHEWLRRLDDEPFLPSMAVVA